MLTNVILGCFHLCVTVIIHGLAMIIATHFFRRWLQAPQVAPLPIEMLRVSMIVILLFAATLLEAAWWAANYLLVDAFESFESALYFSMVTYTTLGYGDITLDEQWRLLSAFQAANGVIIAGWSTALLFALIQKIYVVHHPDGQL